MENNLGLAGRAVYSTPSRGFLAELAWRFERGTLFRPQSEESHMGARSVTLHYREKTLRDSDTQKLRDPSESALS